MNPVTYSLIDGSANAEAFRLDVRSFTDECMDHAAETLGPVVADFARYLEAFKLEDPRRTEEYYLELLSFGILWRSYGGCARAVRHAPFVTLARMAECARTTPGADRAPGVVRT